MRHSFRPLENKNEVIPVFLPGKSHEQRSLAGYSPQSHKESDSTQHSTEKGSQIRTFPLHAGKLGHFEALLKHLLCV